MNRFEILGGVTSRLRDPLNRSGENQKRTAQSEQHVESPAEVVTAPQERATEGGAAEFSKIAVIWQSVMRRGYVIGQEVSCHAPKRVGNDFVTNIEANTLETALGVKAVILEAYASEVNVRVIPNKFDASKVSRLVEIRLPIVKSESQSATIH